MDNDGTWHDLPAGEVGVLVISGPTVFAGYSTGRDEHGPVLDGLGKLVHGWLDTGDLARVDPDGFVRLHGRAKDLIIRGGHNIDPATIEDALLAHPQVTAAAAVGHPDVHSGEIPVAYVTLTPGSHITEADLLAWAGERVPERAAAPHRVTVLDTLPVTDVGKPYKLALRADATGREIRHVLHEIAGVDNVTATIDGGSIRVIVELAVSADRHAVEAILGRYTVSWNVVAAR